MKSSKSDIPDILLDINLWKEATMEAWTAAAGIVSEEIGHTFEFISLKEFSCAGRSFHIAVFKHLKTSIIMHLIPGGKIFIGTEKKENELEYVRRFYPNRDLDFFDLEPFKKVIIEPFLIGQFPVTCRQFGKLLRKLKDQKWSGGNFPVVDVTSCRVRKWLDKAGGDLCLPSSAEWEFACRAGSDTRFFWGDEMDSTYCFDKSSGPVVREVTTHAGAGNSFGLVDMAGNVSELCSDEYQDPEFWYADGYYLIRGGNVSLDAAFCRSAAVNSYWAKSGSEFVGFRVSRSLF
ncbi:MAG: formylglycine-generating enzyme family protein [Spirochaetales bacterium]|nr:formylglycine-generating enzyme family protein [Spirochaetales bacterium]